MKHWRILGITYFALAIGQVNLMPASWRLDLNPECNS
jgi:hypothetical protein